MDFIHCFQQKVQNQANLELKQSGIISRCPSTGIHGEKDLSAICSRKATIAKGLVATFALFHKFIEWSNITTIHINLYH